MLHCKLSCLLLCFYFLIGCVPEVKGKGKEVIGILDSSAELPCEVDIEKCGEVFYITWAKDISNEWKRIYFNDGGRMEKALQELALPDKAKFFMNDSSAHLRISQLRIEDEGSYRCDVTYTKPCPSLTFSSLIIQVRPSPPEIRNEDELINHGKIIGPFREEAVLSLECESYGGKPTAKVSWWKDDESLESDISYTNNSYGSKDIKSSIDLVLTREDIGSRLMCRVENEALDKPLESWVEVDLNVEPSSLEISGPTEPVQEGDIISLNCTVEGAKPAAEITWYNISKVLIPSPEPIIEEMPDNTFRTISELEIEVSKFDHEGIFYCQGANDLIKDQPLEHSFGIEVEYPPAVVIEPEEGITVIETKQAVFNCSYEANPETILDIDWYKDGKELSLSDDSKYSTSNTSVPSLTILAVDREDRGVYTCSLTNSIGRGTSSNSVELRVLYPPEVKVEISPSVINERESKTVSLFCETVEGNPEKLLKIRWYKNDEFLNQVTDKISWMEITRNFSGNYSCEAENEAGWGNRSDNEELIVRYVPGQAYITEDEEPTQRGESVNLTCNVEEPGLPDADYYYWELDGELLDENNMTLVIDNANLQHEGNYSCSAFNDVGTGEKGYHFLDVKVPPKFIIELPELHGASRDVSFYNITCRVECDPICEIEWLRDEESIMDSPYYIITEEILPEEEKNNYFSSVISILRWNMTAWPGGKLDRERDSGEYTCKSTDNEVGEGVESNMQFSVEYAPENVKLSQNFITLEEGDDFDPIECSASSWPLSTYLWLFNESFIVGNGSTLDLGEVTRKDAGIYTCEAKNDRGKAKAAMLLEIRFIPICDIKRTDDDDETILKCTSDARSEVKYYWSKDNETLDEDVDLENSNSTIRFKRYDEEFYGEYECIVENNMGESEPCGEFVTKPEGYGDTIWDPATGEKKIFIIAAIIGGIAILFLIIIVVIIILMRRKRHTDASAAKSTAPETLYQNIEAADHKENGLSEPESKAMYENMPFFGRTKGPFRPDINDDLLYADMYDDIKLGKIPDPRMKPPLPPKGIGKKPKEPPLPPKTRKKAPSGDII